MRHVTAAVRALPVTFVVYMVEACLALLLTLPIGLELLDDGRASLSSALGRAAWLDLLPALAPALRMHATASVLHLVLLLLLAPWLHLSWLYALSRPSGVGPALGEGARLYLRAWLVTFWVALVATLASAPFLVSAALVERVLGDGDARLHDLVLATVCLPLLPVLWWAHVLHDLARARSLTRGAWAAVRSSLTDAARIKVQLVALLLSAAASGAAVVAWLLVGRGTVPQNVPAFLLLQLACLLALFLRSVWLAHTVACAEHSVTSRDGYD